MQDCTPIALFARDDESYSSLTSESRSPIGSHLRGCSRQQMASRDDESVSLSLESCSVLNVCAAYTIHAEGGLLQLQHIVASDCSFQQRQERVVHSVSRSLFSYMRKEKIVPAPVSQSSTELFELSLLLPVSSFLPNQTRTLEEEKCAILLTTE